MANMTPHTLWNSRDTRTELPCGLYAASVTNRNQEVRTLMKISRRLCVSVALRMFLTSCGAAMFLWPSGLAAQAPPGPLPSHDPTDAPPASQTPSRDASKSKLAGTWKLNQDQSDDPHQKMQQAAGNSGGPGGNRGGYGGGGRGGYGGGGGRQQGQGMMAEYSQLAIDQTDTTVKVT